MTSQEQLAIVTECRASGMTAKAWCEERGINYRQYVTWATKLNNKSNHPPQQWADVTLVKERADSEIKIQCGKWIISVDHGFSPVLLTDVLKAMDALC
ncbi:hypothetical protein GTO89_08505 [Heliobacterium gestii]|uniref:Transposase n=1 Tax=Heliomicrobium gestii TaxID=2699 RepID=A0A845LJN3_HELGE|nr:hypothetical protein [Heliomicrobium gestii]MBM7866644.1 hypothetical protein [Heliomicrobium gestii]MZP43076.1 hypothetical protein [Heliomicrobium gestii]